MRKFYLGDKGIGLKEGDIIYFEMPSFCTGEYKAITYKDEGGLYINEDDNYFKSRHDDWRVNKPYWSEEYQ